MNSDSSQTFSQTSPQSLDPLYRDFFGAGTLSIALIGPDTVRRNAVAGAITECHGGEFREFSSYPPNLDDVPGLLEQQYNVILIDLDGSTEYALELVESISAHGVATVAVYSERSDPDLVFRSMRSGAREFLCLPFTQSAMAEALVRAAARRPASGLKKAGGKLLVFLGSKGGAGVTTIACNFAAALALDLRQTTLLIDLDLPFGDTAFNLGLAAEFSTVNALQNATRLDAGLLSTLVVKHSSGLNVLAAPGRFPDFQPCSNPIEKVEYPQYRPCEESIHRLVTVARQNFDNVVVDVGSKLEYIGTSLFKEARTIYLVTQPGASELRNANSLIGQFFGRSGPKLEIVVNRVQQRGFGVDDDFIEKALVKPPEWQIPTDDTAVRQMQRTGTPFALEDFAISRVMRQMAGSVIGQSVSLSQTPEKKKRFGLGAFRKAAPVKDTVVEDEPGPARFIPSAALSMRPDVKANNLDPFVYSPPANKLPSVGLPAQREESTPMSAADFLHYLDVKREESPSVPPPTRQDKPDTRYFQGPANGSGPDSQYCLPPLGNPGATEEEPAAALPSPDSNPFATPFSDAQFSATSSVAGRPVIASADTAKNAPPFGAPMKVAKPAPASAPPKVVRTTPVIAWATPDPIVYGAVLGAAQFNATASVPGAFTYTPAAGTVPSVGTQTLRATFTPEDTVRYATAQTTVTLQVSKATPVITWETPDAITYGAALGAAQFNATASIPGRFVYTPAAGVVPQVGTQTLRATFTPADTSKYTPAQSTVTLQVAKAPPVIAWATPDPVIYGAALGIRQFNATASVPGRFVYTPPVGTVPTAGAQALQVTFIPADTAKYATAQAAVTLEVGIATPSINWAIPDPIIYGAALGEVQCNATASVPGTFVYTPAMGALLTAGVQTLEAAFTPDDTVNYGGAQATVTIEVAKATPAITWATPDPILYGTTLGEAQFNATAPVPGTFVYTPGMGAVPTAGEQTLEAAFTPDDTVNYATAQASVTLEVRKATPAIVWATPDSILYGAALGEAQCNATASVPGTFVYTPAFGIVLTAGIQTLEAIFIPDDTSNYATAQASVTLEVGKATPAIAWATPDPIVYGAALGDAQFNATASVPGTFVYTPDAGIVPLAGPQTLTASFTPDDAVNYAEAQASVTLQIGKKTPTVTWPRPDPIVYGTELGDTQCNAKTSIPGKLVYTPAAGTVPGVGAQTLQVTFTPADNQNYAAAHATVTLEVTKVTPAIAWATPDPIVYGATLDAKQFNATASVPGTFVYAPAIGAVPTVGAQRLQATFTPDDNVHYATAQATVTLDVYELPDIDLLAPEIAPPVETAASAIVAAASRAMDAWDGAGLAGNQQQVLESGSAGIQMSDFEMRASERDVDANRADDQGWTEEDQMKPTAGMESPIPPTLPTDFAEWDLDEAPTTMAENFDIIAAAAGCDAASWTFMNPIKPQGSMPHERSEVAQTSDYRAL